ncbi:MAG: hypothetical protein JXR37_00280 [Kiritimatiellae bacterium]|nr:hypothetical protein [Kiritimatiellia bacterium]
MDTIYTTTITDEARRRGIAIRVIDYDTPIFELSHGGRRVRCYNSLTDKVGAVTYEIAQDKHLANQFLRQNGISVPDQAVYRNPRQAERFLRKHGAIVVKPNKEWGARGVAVAIKTPWQLRQAVRDAAKYPDEKILLEQCVEGVDHRLIMVDYRFVAAIERTPARVVGNGKDDIRTLIRKKNADAEDPSNKVPLDNETRRNLASFGLSYGAVPRKGRRVQVRRTSNYHTGGTIRIITESVDRELVKYAEKIARLFQVPVFGVDFLVNRRARKWWVIETSADLAISPPEGEEVARHFLDYLFPATKRNRE